VETASSTYIGVIGEKDEEGRTILKEARIHTALNTPVQTQQGFGIHHNDVFRPFGPLLHPMTVHLTPVNIILLEELDPMDSRMLHKALEESDRALAQQRAQLSGIATPNAPGIIVPS